MSETERSEYETQIKKWTQPVTALALPIKDEVAVVRSQADYNQCGAVIAACRKAEAEWEKLTKRDPLKLERDCAPLEGLVFFPYGAYQKALNTFNTGRDAIRSVLLPHVEGVRQYDLRKQQELQRRQEEQAQIRRDAEAAAERARLAEESKRLEAQRKEQEAERARLAAANAKTAEERHKAEEQVRAAEDAQKKLAAQQAKLRDEQLRSEREAGAAENRMNAALDKAAEIDRGPEGTSKVQKFIPIVNDLPAYEAWCVRTTNYHLCEPDMGLLTKHVNALAGKNLPDGVSVRREDVIRRKA